MAKEEIEFKDGFDRLNRLLEQADEKEISDFFNPGEEKGADPVVQENSSDVLPVSSEVVESTVQSDSGDSGKKSSTRRRKVKDGNSEVKDGTEQLASVHYCLPVKKRSLLKFIAIHKGKSMNACIDEAMEQFFSSFTKEFCKRYGGNELVLRAFTDCFD